MLVHMVAKVCNAWPLSQTDSHKQKTPDHETQCYISVLLPKVTPLPIPEHGSYIARNRETAAAYIGCWCSGGDYLRLERGVLALGGVGEGRNQG